MAKKEVIAQLGVSESEEIEAEKVTEQAKQVKPIKVNMGLLVEVLVNQNMRFKIGNSGGNIPGDNAGWYVMKKGKTYKVSRQIKDILLKRGALRAT